MDVQVSMASGNISLSHIIGLSFLRYVGQDGFIQVWVCLVTNSFCHVNCFVYCLEWFNISCLPCILSGTLMLVFSLIQGMYHCRSTYNSRNILNHVFFVRLAKNVACNMHRCQLCKIKYFVVICYNICWPLRRAFQGIFCIRYAE